MPRIPDSALADILSLYCDGEPMQGIIDKLGLNVTRQAVAQLIDRQSNTHELREYNRLAVGRRKIETQRAVRREMIDARLKPYREPSNRTVRRHGGMGVKYTDEQLLQAMRDWREKYSDPVSIARWNKAADPEFPSGATYLNRFESWNSAKTLAGLPVIPAMRDNYKTKWTDEQLLEYVRTYVEWQLAGDKTPSFERLSQWLKTIDDAPSPALLRNRLSNGTGGWYDIVERAVATKI